MVYRNLTNNNPFLDVYEQYVDNASFLWLLRSIVLKQPHYVRHSIVALEKRIDNSLDGLSTAPEDAWILCEQNLESGDPGEIFTSAIVAFWSLEQKKVQQVVEVALKQESTVKALCSAMAWLPKKFINPWLEKFIRSKDLEHKYLAVCVMSALRIDPGDYLVTLLQREDCVAHVKLYSRCLRLVGEIKRRDLMPALNSAMELDDSSIQFWALWSSAMLGNRALYERYEPFVFEENVHQDRALEVLFRTAPIDVAQAYISKLAKSPDLLRTAIKASGILGDPRVVPWLLSVMKDSKHARVAAEAFSTITGIHLEENDLSIEVRNMDDVVPEDDSSDDGLDPDEYSPWPDVGKLNVVWQKYGGQYKLKERYFLGQTIGRDFLESQINGEGFQCHRQAAAMELTLGDVSMILPNVEEKLVSPL